MSVIINSGVDASASHESSLTYPPLILNAPNRSQGMVGSISIANVIGLQAVLDGKLNDTAGPVGISTVFANGVDLNILAGMNAFGLTQGDLQKLSQVDATAVEINYLQGVTGPIQAQIDGAYSASDFTAADQMIVSTGLGTGTIASISDVLDGTLGIGYEFSDLRLATGSLDFNNQRGINAANPVNPQDVATKGYVDVAVLGAGSFLPLAGGTMNGAIDMNGSAIVLDIDGDTTLSAAVDDTVVLNVSGTAYTWTATGVSMASQRVVDVANPLNPQDAATKNYIDTSFLPLSGGIMTGAIDMNGSTIVLDVPGTVSMINNVPNQMTLAVNGTGYVFTDTSIDFDGSDLANLPAVPATPLSAIHTTFANANYLRLNGANGPMTGTLDMGGQILLNPVDPTLGTHVGDRDYNDTRYTQRTNNLSDLTNIADAKNNLSLSTVATTGNYSDLIGQPTIVVNLDDLADVITGVPGPAQDGHVLTWNNTGSNYGLLPAAVRSVFGRTGNITAAFGDYTGLQVTNTPAGNITATDVQSAIDELDAEKLARDGSQNMTGNLDMNNNQIVNVGLPLTIGSHVWSTADYRSGLGSNGFLIRTTAAPSAALPTYSFVADSDTGMYSDGTAVHVSVNGADRLTISATEVSANALQVKDVADPTDDQDAVTVNYLRTLGVQRILGQATGIDLQGATPGQSFTLYTVPTGRRHVITKVILIATSYAPGVSPVDPVVSIGTGGPSFDQVIDTVTVSWGPAGSGDQAVYVDPDQGAETPNSSTVITLLVNAPAGGTFANLTVSAYIMGFEL